MYHISMIYHNVRLFRNLVTLYKNIDCIISSSNHLVHDYTYIDTLKNTVGTGNIQIEQDSKLEINEDCNLCK